MKQFIIITVVALLGTLAGCGSSSPSTYTVGGTLSGLSGTVVLQNNAADDLTLTANGAFTFATALADAAAYAVTVLTNPTGQTCTATGGTGTISGANVTNITVDCVYTNAIIFITNTPVTGNIGGVAGADALCAADANKPDSRTYKALIVDGTARVACTNVGCFSGTSGQTDWVLAASTDYYRSDATTIIGTTTANKVFNLVTGLTNSLTDSSLYIWTGLIGDWTTASDTCTQWTSASNALTATVGTANSKIMAQPFSSGVQPCDNSAAVYLACVSQ